MEHNLINRLISKEISHIFPEPPDKPIVIELIDRMYSVKDIPEHNWTWHAFNGFYQLAKEAKRMGKPIKRFASIGTGSGIDAIGAAMAFPDLTDIIVTDVEKHVVVLAVENIRKNVSPSILIKGLVGDVCFPLISDGITVDLVYTNLPNIPASEAELIDHGTFYRRMDEISVNPIIDSYLLSMQQRFLMSLPAALQPGGFAAVMIGGRFPYETIEQLASITRFRISEILSKFKLQTEAINVASGYAAAETETTKFHFYKHKEAKEYINGCGRENALSLQNELAPWRISATEALKEVKAGRSIGHIVHMLKAVPRSH
ncbi:class I SAM-dependent methyltransferase [Lonsdalea quercina]|uniref:hypothetical protein n=1 Tax=Lonsdalea quercina TaxID=71657 RepID=UPI0039750CC5